MSLGTLLIVVLIVLAVVLVGGFVAATRVKRRIDTDKPVAVRAKKTITVSPACVERLRILSAEPVLVKLEEGVLRFQADKRPLAPVAIAPDEAGKGLREVGTVLVTEFGAHWVAVVQPVGDDTVSVDRLA
jgi:hypothetical protein